jgi:hypothetical protein
VNTVFAPDLHEASTVNLSQSESDSTCIRDLTSVNEHRNLAD